MRAHARVFASVAARVSGGQAEPVRVARRRARDAGVSPAVRSARHLGKVWVLDVNEKKFWWTRAREVFSDCVAKRVALKVHNP